LKIECTGTVSPDGRLSLDPAVLSKISAGERVKVVVVPLSEDASEEAARSHVPDPAAERFLSRLDNAPDLGRIRGDLSREDIYEEMADDGY